MINVCNWSRLQSCSSGGQSLSCNSKLPFGSYLKLCQATGAGGLCSKRGRWQKGTPLVLPQPVTGSDPGFSRVTLRFILGWSCPPAALQRFTNSVRTSLKFLTSTLGSVGNVFVFFSPPGFLFPQTPPSSQPKASSPGSYTLPDLRVSRGGGGEKAGESF